MTFRESLRNSHHNFSRQEWGEVGILLKNASLPLEEPQGQPVEIIDSPFPSTLPTYWSRALGEIGCDHSPPNWRRPIIVIPEARTSSWPHSTEMRRELKFKVRGSTIELTRNLVCIDIYDRHAYFEPDLDPWRLGAVGTSEYAISGIVSGRHETIKRLPRPLHILPLSMTFTEMVQALQKRLDCSCGQENRAYYIPPQGWDPRTISKDEWRRGNFFHTDSVQDGRRGAIDREGFIWLWDPFHNAHWDVQLPDGSQHRNISHDGKVL